MNLGLIPGGGGTQRLPRMIQPMEALQMLLKGDPIDLVKAKSLGIVGSVVPAADLIKASKEWIKAGGKAVAPWDEKGFKLPGGPVQSPAGYETFTAGNALLRAVEQAGGTGVHDALPGRHRCLGEFAVRARFGVEIAEPIHAPEQHSRFPEPLHSGGGRHVLDQHRRRPFGRAKALGAS